MPTDEPIEYALERGTGLRKWHEAAARRAIESIRSPYATPEDQALSLQGLETDAARAERYMGDRAGLEQSLDEADSIQSAVPLKVMISSATTPTESAFADPHKGASLQGRIASGILSQVVDKLPSDALHKVVAAHRDRFQTDRRYRQRFSQTLADNFGVSATALAWAALQEDELGEVWPLVANNLDPPVEAIIGPVIDKAISGLTIKPESAGWVAEVVPLLSKAPPGLLLDSLSYIKSELGPEGDRPRFAHWLQSVARRGQEDSDATLIRGLMQDPTDMTETLRNRNRNNP